MFKMLKFVVVVAVVQTVFISIVLAADPKPSLESSSFSYQESLQRNWNRFLKDWNRVSVGAEIPNSGEKVRLLLAFETQGLTVKKSKEDKVSLMILEAQTGISSAKASDGLEIRSARVRLIPYLKTFDSGGFSVGESYYSRELAIGENHNLKVYLVAVGMRDRWIKLSESSDDLSIYTDLAVALFGFDLFQSKEKFKHLNGKVNAGLTIATLNATLGLKKFFGSKHSFEVFTKGTFEGGGFQNTKLYGSMGARFSFLDPSTLRPQFHVSLAADSQIINMNYKLDPSRPAGDDNEAREFYSVSRFYILTGGSF